LTDVQTSVRSFRRALARRQTRVKVDESKVVKIELWCQGFVDALNELEQSVYCSEQYSHHIHKAYLELMTTAEMDDYRRFVYFYKNGLIRVFSILDKLGYFMNELLDLRTERIKAKFSFFTVLRNLKGRGNFRQLEEQLNELKTKHRAILDTLRNQRNMEIHYINVEMLDDMMDDKRRGGDRIRVENVHRNVAELKLGYEMVCRSLTVTLTYLSRK